MASSVDRRGIDSVIEGYNTFSEYSPIYSVWQGRNLKFQFNDEDIQRGQDLLLSNLEAIRQTGSDAVFTIRFHTTKDKDGFISDKTPYVGSFNFKVSEPTNQLGNLAGAEYTSNSPILSKLDKILDQQNELQSRIAALEEQDEDEDEEKPNDIMGMLSGIMQTPVGQQIITGLLGAITKNIAPQQPAAKQVGLAGIPSEEEKIQDAIERLKTIDPEIADDLQKLAHIAETQKGTFEFLVKNLRSM